MALSASYKHCGKLFPPASDYCIILNPLSLQLANHRAFTIWICVHEDCGDLPPCHLLHDRCERRLFVLPLQSRETATGYTTSQYYLYRRRRRRTGDASLRVQCKKPIRKLTRGEDEHLCVTEGVKILHVTLALDFVSLYQRSRPASWSHVLEPKSKMTSPFLLLHFRGSTPYAKYAKTERPGAGRRVRSWCAVVLW